MTCPECGGATKVQDSRMIEESRKSPLTNTIRRRRVCLVNHEHRFTTLEILASSVSEGRMSKPKSLKTALGHLASSL